MTRAPFTRTPKPNGWKDPKLQATNREWADTEKLLRRVLDLVVGAREAEAELRDMANSSIAGGSVSLGRSSSPTSATHALGISDMTGSVATSGTHAYMRRQLHLAEAELPQFRKELNTLRRRADTIEGILKRAALSALDSDMADKFAHDEETAAGYRQRHRRPA